MLIFIPDTLLQGFTWLVVLIAIATALVLLVLFGIHRRNTYQRILQLEEKMHEHDEIIFRQAEIQTDKFKKAIQAHLSEISQRIAKNEEHTNRLINQLEDLRALLTDEDENDKGGLNGSNV